MFIEDIFIPTYIWWFMSAIAFGILVLAIFVVSTLKCRKLLKADEQMVEEFAYAKTLAEEAIEEELRFLNYSYDCGVEPIQSTDTQSMWMKHNEICQRYYQTCERDKVMDMRMEKASKRISAYEEAIEDFFMAWRRRKSMFEALGGFSKNIYSIKRDPRVYSIYSTLNRQLNERSRP